MESEAAENIKVGVRIRPLNERELASGGVKKWRAESLNAIKEVDGETTFVFDRVYDEDTSTIDVYREQGHIVIQKFMQGFHGCIFCYGQTGSGKTHTMYGERKKNPGIVPISVDQIFANIEESKSTDFLLRCCYVEIYNESVNDLLNPEKLNLNIVEDKKSGIKIKDVTENICTSYTQVASLLQIGDKHKNVASTNFNQRSSRSHSIFRIIIEIKTNSGPITTATLNLIDLAGSESANVHGANINAGRSKETKCINRVIYIQSLLTLGTVIMRLSDKKNNAPIPFRDSKLTRLLQPALEGNSKVSIICNISSVLESSSETLSTLNFAKRAKKITQKIVKNLVLDNKALIIKYQQEINELQSKLREMENRLESEEKTYNKMDSSLHVLELIEEKEKAEAKVDNILQEKLQLEKELKMMKSFILNSDEIKPGKRIVNLERIKKEVIRGLLHRITGTPLSRKIVDIPEVKAYERQESLLTEGIDDIMQEFSKLDNEVKKENIREEEKKEEQVEIVELSIEKKVEEQQKIIKEMAQALKEQDDIIKKMSEDMSEKDVEIELLKEELKMYKINLTKANTAARFMKLRKVTSKEKVEENKNE